MANPLLTDQGSPSAQIDAKLAGLGDWRGKVLAQLRRLIREADPEVIEAVKWVKPSNPSGVPVWEHAGIICTGEVYKAYVKLTFAQGAALEDPALAAAHAGQSTSVRVGRLTTSRSKL